MLVNPEIFAAQTQRYISLNFLKILVFCRNDGLLMENYGLGTHSDKMCADKYFNWKYVPQIPHNLFGPSAQIDQLFGIFLKKAFIRCLLFMISKIN